MSYSDQVITNGFKVINITNLTAPIHNIWVIILATLVPRYFQSRIITQNWWVGVSFRIVTLWSAIVSFVVKWTVIVSLFCICRISVVASNIVKWCFTKSYGLKTIIKFRSCYNIRKPVYFYYFYIIEVVYFFISVYVICYI